MTVCRLAAVKTGSAPVAALVFLSFFALTHSIEAQDFPTGRLMDELPYDILTLDRANDGKVFKVYPIRLPGRRVPEKPKPTDKIRVKLLESEEEYDVAWQNVAKLELYEQLVVAEVNKFTAEGRLDDAY